MSDVRIESDSSMVVITPVSHLGRQWLSENAQYESWQWLGRSLAIDKRFAADIVEGMIGDGLDVEAD
jgi:hypothetical protein